MQASILALHSTFAEKGVTIQCSPLSSIKRSPMRGWFAFWDRFTGERDGTLWYYDQLVAVMTASIEDYVARLEKARAEMAAF